MSETLMTPPAAPVSIDLRPQGGRIGADRLLLWLSSAAAAAILLMLASLLLVLITSAWPSIKAFGFSFLVKTEWRSNELEVERRTPDGKLVFDADGEQIIDRLPPVFGALPVMWGTAVSSVIALVFAIPLSFGTALFLIRLVPKNLAGTFSFLVEFLAAIPSIAYGMWGLFVFGPFMQKHIEPVLNGVFSVTPGMGWLHFEGQVSGRDMLCGGLILGVMIIPIITAIGRDVLTAVPRAQLEGTTALGATWWQSSKEMLKFSRSGLFGAVMLGLARAAGETMAVTMVIGNRNEISASPLAPAQSMASLLANEFQEASAVQRSALVEVALILLVMSLVFNVVARRLVVGKGARTAAAH
jgi:phosphate transport system permease protein